MDLDESYYRRLAAQAGLRFLRLEPGDIDRGAAQLLPGELARRLGVIAVAADAETVTVAAGDPTPTGLAGVVRGLTGRRLDLVISEPDRIRRAQVRAFGSPSAL